MGLSPIGQMPSGTPEMTSELKFMIDEKIHIIGKCAKVLKNKYKLGSTSSVFRSETEV